MGVRGMIGTMSFLRHDRFPLIAALLAALAVLFVSTASMACEVPVDQDMASMSMSGSGEPCEEKVPRISCQKACLIFCQSLIPQVDGPMLGGVYASVRYPALEVRRPAFTLEADDPPPRT